MGESSCLRIFRGGCDVTRLRPREYRDATLTSATHSTPVVGGPVAVYKGVKQISFQRRQTLPEY